MKSRVKLHATALGIAIAFGIGVLGFEDAGRPAADVISVRGDTDAAAPGGIFSVAYRIDWDAAGCTIAFKRSITDRDGAQFSLPQVDIMVRPVTLLILPTPVPRGLPLGAARLSTDVVQTCPVLHFAGSRTTTHPAPDLSFTVSAQ